MHHLNFFLKYKLLKDINSKDLLYYEIDEIIEKNHILIIMKSFILKIYLQQMKIIFFL